MKKVAKRIVAAAVCVAVVGGVGAVAMSRSAANRAALAASASAPEEAAIPVNIQTPQTGDLEVTTDYIGRMQPDEVVNILPKMAGTVLDTYFNVGDRVQKGDLLFELDASDLDATAANLSAIEASAIAAEAGYKLAQVNVASGLGSQLDLKLLQTDSNYKSAQNSYDQAHKALSDYINDYEPNVDKLEESMDDLRDARDELDKALKNAEQNFAQIKGPYEEAQKAYKEANDAYLADYAEYTDYINASIGSSGDGGNLSLLESKMNASKARRDLLAARVEPLEKQYTTLSSGVSAAQSAVSNNKSLYDQVRTQYDNAKNGYDTNLDGLKTAVKNASLGLDTSAQTKDITDDKGVPEAKEAADAQLEQARAQYEASNKQFEQQKMQLEKQLSYTKITSPIDGVVELKSVEPFGVVSQQTPAYVISNKDIMVVKFSVSASAATQMTVGDAVRVENGSAAYNGSIIEVGSMVDQQNGLFPVKARVDAPEGALLTGVAVKVSASTQKAQQALLIPVDSLYHDEDQAYVYVMADDGTAVKTDVQTGITDDETVEVISGLEPSSKVITSWNPNLIGGAKVADIGAAQAAASKEAGAPDAPSPEAEDAGASSSAQENSGASAGMQDASSGGGE